MFHFSFPRQSPLVSPDELELAFELLHRLGAGGQEQRLLGKGAGGEAVQALGQLDMVSLVSDQGEVQWALVKSPTATPQAKYVGSLKNFSTAASDFLNYCNPK